MKTATALILIGTLLSTIMSEAKETNTQYTTAEGKITTYQYSDNGTEIYRSVTRPDGTVTTVLVH